jgi:uncharacterized protein (DUF362 family)
MSCRMNRRTWLARSLGTAAVLAGAGRLRRPAAALAAPKRPDRSAEAPAMPVGIQRCESFEPQLLRRRLDALLDSIGGIKKLVENKTVTIKINLTGLQWRPFGGMPAYETYQTHPNTVAALCGALSDAGARRIVVVENPYWDRPFEETLRKEGWDVAAIQSAGAGRVSFEDTRNRGSFPAYSRFKVPWGGFIYPAFDLNQRFEKTDVLVSLAKLKQHACAGVTGAVKNFFGIAPTSLYGNDAPDENPKNHRTSMFHDGRKRVPDGVPAELPNDVHDGNYRVPRIVADIFGARPADLNFVDGIRTIRGGEGYWNRGVAVVEPKVILAGRNGVSTDAVCTAVMGFDPQAPHGKPPFPGDNHLRLLASVGVGTNDLGRIEIAGLPLKDAIYPFQPKRKAKA